MKILYITDHLYLHGGVEKVLSQKANYMADVLGHEIVIATYNQQGRGQVYPFSLKIQMFDLGVNYEIATSYFNPINLKKVPHHRAALQKLLRDICPDILISCSFGPDFYFLPYLERQIPKIKEFHGSRFFTAEKAQTFGKKIMAMLNRFTERRYDSIVVLNESEKEYFSNRNIVVLPNPAEITDAHADLNSKCIIAAGRISPVKNFGDLITAFSIVSADFPDWELHFYGEDYLDTQRKLEQQVTGLGLPQQILFKGTTPDLKNTMRSYSIYAMTSESECFPMVLLEALSVGMPVISYDSPTGPKHIVRDGEDSMLVPYKNLDIFTEKLKLLMSDENLRIKMGRRAVENVQRFNINIVMQRWIALCNELVKKK